MKDGKKNILHVTFDGVFFDILSSEFEKLEGYSNIYLVLRNPECNNGFKCINNSELITVVHDEKEMDLYFSNPDIDIVFFHGLWPWFYKYYGLIRDDVITIWFCYGQELYETVPGYPCLIRQKLFKPRSFWFYYKDYIKRFHFFRAIIGYVLPFYDLLRGNTDRRHLISRMDYIQTPLRIEYEMLKKLSYFKAKPFKMDGRGIEPEESRIVFHEKGGSILINHSAAFTNNVLDVMKVLSRNNVRGRELLFPIVYGYEEVKEKVKQYEGFNGNKTVFIENKLPLREYEMLMASCTHAIYGTLRQQALGNIFNCFRTGVKVFLYKDSMNYRQLKQDGFAVFAIEDISESELSVPLTKDEAIRNNRLYYSKYGIHSDYLEKQLDLLFVHMN